MSHRSDPELLILHAVSLLGFADEIAIAERAGARTEETTTVLRQAEHVGCSTSSSSTSTAGP